MQSYISKKLELKKNKCAHKGTKQYISQINITRKLDPTGE